MKAKILLRRALEVSERFRVELKVYEVGPSLKYPEGVKARYALIDVINKLPRLIVDNHAPFGFHAHRDLPEAPNKRLILDARNHIEALDEFWNLVSEVLKNEN